jgi:hypothetical protein
MPDVLKIGLNNQTWQDLSLVVDFKGRLEIAHWLGRAEAAPQHTATAAAAPAMPGLFEQRM